jgi:signal transduction histidine kinase
VAKTADKRTWRTVVWRVAGELCVVALVALLMYELKDNLNPSTIFEQHFIPPLWAAVTAAAALIVAARRYPRWCAVLAPLLAAYLPIAAPMLAVVTYRVAARRVMRTWLLLVLAVVAPVVCGVAASIPWGTIWVWDTVNVLVTITVTCAVLPVVAAGVISQRERFLEALRGRTDALERSRRVSDAAARLAERHRIAREMHDAIGHRLSLISLYSGSLQLSTESDPQLHGQAALVQDSAAAALRELREVLGVLTTSDASTDGDATGGSDGVRTMVEQSRAAGVKVDLAWEGDDLEPVRPVVRQAVQRVVQECLTNVHRHAAGSEAHVTVAVTDDDVSVTALNGPDPTRHGDTSGSRRGLVGLRERVEILGGHFEAGPGADGGFTVTARLPRTSRKVEPGTIDPEGAVEPLDAASPPRRFAALRQRVGIPALLTLGLIAVSALFAFTLLVVPAPQVPDSSLDDLVAPGMPRGDVEAILGHSDELVRTLAHGHEPKPPSGDRQCWYRVMGDDGGATITVWRLCFVRDLLNDDMKFKVRVGQ